MTTADEKPTTLKRPPTKAQVAAAQLIVKRKCEGRGAIEITPQIGELAAMSVEDVAFDA
ncbi:RNA helicase [Corynebacterium cystitidis]|uniref:RNA helicase n=1 Tax=Corynebacterium cystitidis TaxID=35757 RepID=UPI00211EA85A|nr:RNA helicase [Corynebacterium cystitidis]